MHENIRKKRGRWESFDDISGLGHGCTCLLEDRNGNLWIGTWKGGLSRYDGQEFVNFTTKDGLVGNYIWCIHQDKEGNIWIGTAGWMKAKSGLSRYDGQEFVNFTTKDGLASNNVRCIYQDKEGNIWIGTGGWKEAGGGLSRYDGQEFVNFTTKDGLADNNISCIYQDKEGDIWIGTGGWRENGGGLSKYDGKRFVNFTTKDGLADNDISCIHQDKEGNIWIGTGGWREVGGGLSKYDGKKFVNFTTKDGLAGNSIFCIYQDKEGNLWIGTRGGGVSCYDGHEFITFNTEDGLTGNFVQDIIQDREGSLWFACWHAGISRYSPCEISYISDENVNEVMIQDSSGNLWWGSGNVLSQFDGKEIAHYSFESKIEELFEDRQGQFWVGTQDRGVFICDNIKDKDLTRIGQGKPCPYITRNLTVADGLVNNWILKIYEDIKGNIWIGTYNGVSCYDGKKFTNFTTDAGLGNNLVSVICQDKNGNLWFAGWNGGGLSSYDGKNFRRYTTDSGLASDDVICVIEDDKNNLWIGTHAGISCYNGKSFKNYTTADGLLGSIVHRMIQDRSGQIWVATLGGGISRFDGKDFQALTTEDGLPSNNVTGIIEDRKQETGNRKQGKDSEKIEINPKSKIQNPKSNNPQSDDGSFIISTYKGIIRYVPDYKTPPLIRVDEVDADKIYKRPEDIQMSKSIPSIRIKYHGISFKTKRMRYSYILEGYDKEWKATWDKEVRYENLPVGEYTFKVVAINRDLVYSEKPAALKLTVQPDPRDLEFAALQLEVGRLRQEVGRKYYFDSIIGRSAPIKQVYALMEKAIDSGLTVLLMGETGTGKEMVAKAIHYNSPRKAKPLLDVNCGALPKDLIASTLFGHRKGAFTGATEDSIGLFESASGGTLILDEISEMPNEVQVHFLRALQERKIRRVGETKLRDIEVRIIAMTNKDLEAEVKASRFREDLYYRLNVFPIQLPPLRDRLDDIPLLAEHFLQKASHQLGKEIEGFALGVIEMLQSYSWPGNIRELENEINRAAAFVEEGLKIQKYHFSSNITKGESLIAEILSESISYSESLSLFRRRLIENALRECGDNRTEAAKKLGMDRSNLVALIRRMGIKNIK